MTSQPCFFKIRAVQLESTPPLIKTKTRFRSEGVFVSKGLLKDAIKVCFKKKPLLCSSVVYYFLNGNRGQEKGAVILDERIKEGIRAFLESTEGFQTLSLEKSVLLARQFNVSRLEIECATLEVGACPARYVRNMGTLGVEGQLRLLKSHVGVVGCGGLGGYVAEMLARVGIGHLRLIDGDVFSETNLNRQLMSAEHVLGQPKVQVASQRIGQVNGAVSVIAIPDFLDENNAKQWLAGCDLVMDALDNNATRRIAAHACRHLGIPFIHGAIGGFWGQVAVYYPENVTPWEHEDYPNKGKETELGTPPFTPSMVASFQVCEAVKLITKKESQLKEKLAWIDLERVDVQTVPLF